MATRKLFLLPGDGIGPEAMAEVKKLIAALNERLGAGFAARRVRERAPAYHRAGF